MARPPSELVPVLQRLLRFDTTNPPGNESPCARYLAGLFRREGIPCRVLGPKPGRDSVVARLRGGPASPLLLSAHLDVVAAEGRWTRPPFSGELRAGYVWGRGAVDMKHMAAMSAVLLLELKRRRVRLCRDLIFAGVADEEAGGAFGAGWLARRHPSLIRAGHCLTEVGGIAERHPGGWLVPVQTAQKGMVWLRLSADGPGGHGSQPYSGSAIEKLTRALDRLNRTPFPYRLTPAAKAYIEAAASVRKGARRQALLGLLSPRTADAALERLPERERKAFNAMVRDTVAVTGLSAGAQVNVIASRASATLDGRYLPGRGERAFISEVRRRAGPGLELEVLASAAGHEVRGGGPLWDSIVKVMERSLPGCRVSPKLLTGQTDALDYARLGIRTYGFSPLRLERGQDFAELYHAPDERVSVAGLEAGYLWLRDVVLDYCSY